MIHPSYNELLNKVNCDVEEGDAPVVNSRFSIVMASAKRARQIIGGGQDVTEAEARKPLSTAVKELYNGTVTILPEDEAPEEEDTADKIRDIELAVAAQDAKRAAQKAAEAALKAAQEAEMAQDENDDFADFAEAFEDEDLID